MRKLWPWSLGGDAVAPSVVCTLDGFAGTLCLKAAYGSKPVFLSKSIRRAMAALALLTLFAPAAGRAQIPTREGNTWDWRHHEPTRPNVQRRERAAGVAPSRSQGKALNSQVERLDLQLLGNRPSNAGPTVGAEDGSPGGRR